MGYLLTSEQTILKARELARRSGRTLEEVIDEALTAQLSRPMTEASAAEKPDEAARKAAFDAVTADIKSRPLIDMGDYDADLYDENGLWK